MATYDLLMLAILIGLTLYGYFKGMAWQIAYVASFVVSYFIATRFADQIAPRITFVNPPANKFVAMLLIYAVASFGVWMIFRMVRRVIDSVKMEGFDHQMGAILGFGRGVLWCVGVTFIVLTVLPLPVTQKQQVVNSKSGYYIAQLINKTDSLFPPEVHQVVGPYLDRLENELEGSQPPGSFQQPQGGGGWPGTGAAPAAAPAAPAWGQSAPAAAPANSSWPQANNASQAQPATTQPATNRFSWPSEGGGQAATPATPATQASPVSWPEWE